MMIIIIIIIVIVIIIRHFSVQFITKCAVLDGFMQLQNKMFVVKMLILYPHRSVIFSFRGSTMHPA